MQQKTAIPIYSVEISEEEKAQASRTREEFQVLLDLMDEVFDHLLILDNALEGIQDPTGLAQFNKLFLQYKRKAKKLFNIFVKQLEKALLEMNKMVSDSEMERVRDTIVAEVREVRDGAIELFELLEMIEDKQFIQDFRATVERIHNRAESLQEIITDQLFAHIDHDILGQIRLGFELYPLSKRGFLWELSNIPLRQ